jgi:hypothetical protein
VDKVEAQTLIDEQIASYRARSYEDLSTLVGQTIAFQKIAPSGIEYNIEVMVMWDSLPKGGNLRVMVAVDDARWPSWFLPMSNDFILAPDGGFIGESVSLDGHRWQPMRS